MYKAANFLATRASFFAQIKTFLIVGLTAVGVDSLVFFALMHLNVPNASAKGISFVAGSMVAFVLNKRFTFEQPHFHAGELGRFACLYVSTLGANVAVFSATSTLSEFRWPALCFLAATGVSTVLNYVGMRYWVFVPDAKAAPPATSFQTRDYLPALFCATLCGFHLWHTYPSLFQQGTMWAEAAGNYFATAHFHSTLENLVTLDFSYLPLLPRLCALLVHAFHISPAYVPVAYQSIAWVCISLCVAFFALPTFRLLVPSDLARVFVCLALALGPDYEVKTFINFSYYLAIVFYVVLAWCAVDNQVSRRRALVFGCLLTLAGLSKPHFLSFAPVLGCLLLWSIYKRRLWASVLFAMPLTGCVTQLCIAVMHRADIGQGGSVPLMRLLGLWLQWAPLSAASQIAGAMYHRPAVLRILFGSLWVLALAYFGWTKRHAWFRPTLLPLAIGITTMAFGALLSITPYPQQYEVHGGAYPVGLLTSRHWFVPTVVLLLSIAIALGRMLPRRWTPLMIAAWLPFAWPFGWHHRAHDADWPMTHASAWQGFASHVLSPKDGSSPRGCIPINPYPWYYGIDCQLLLPLKDLHANNFSQVASSYMAPPDATSWSVDSVGVRLSPPHTNDRVFVAYNAENQEIGRAIELQSAPSHLTHFLFTTPVERPRRIALLAPPSQDLQIVIDQAEGVPLWTWFGKMLPSPEEASSQAAR